MGETSYNERMALAMQAALFVSSLTPSDLAARLGMTVETVRRWTRGDVEIRASSLAAVCDALDAPADLFVRPPATREEALEVIRTWRAARRGLARADERA